MLNLTEASVPFPARQGASVDARLCHGGDVPRLGERGLDLKSVARQTLEDVSLTFLDLEHQAADEPWLRHLIILQVKGTYPQNSLLL